MFPKNILGNPRLKKIYVFQKFLKKSLLKIFKNQVSETAYFIKKNRIHIHINIASNEYLICLMAIPILKIKLSFPVSEKTSL